mmetsp:Transcript_31843/g.73555  ORF Transcript_31843/g.73555 Transcript_31843/m.73555 type:complete len:80 (+) Transcript_31843:79-318(+)
MSYFSMNPFGSSKEEEEEPVSTGRRKSVLETLHDKAHHEGFSDDEPEGHTEVELEAEAEETEGAPLRPWWTCLVPCAKP